jgi:hypothetical protein
LRGPTFLLHTAVWISAVTAVPAQHRALRHDAAAWVPTEEGSNWSYHRVTTRFDAPGQKGEARIGKGVFGTYLRPDGSRWHLVAVHDGGTRRYEHWNTEGPGLLVQATSRASGTADVRSTCPLAAPVGAVNQWEWQVETKDETFVWRASLVAFDEAVTVPAGSFRAVHVHVEAFGENPGLVETEDSWFARDVGLVRQQRTTDKVQEVTELLAFTRGRDQTQERLATLQMLAPPAWLWKRRGAATIRWLDQDAGSVAFGGRFALVGDGADLQLAFVRPGAFVALAADGAVSWKEIARGESQPDHELIATTAARLHAARLRLADVVIEDEDHGKATLRAAGPAGDRSFSVSVIPSKRDLVVEVQEQTAKR